MRQNNRLGVTLLIILTAGAAACAVAPVVYPPHPLIDEILKVREGHDGNLTNRTCASYDQKTGLCANEKVVDYPLTDADFRATANKFDFICNLGGKRYKICKDKPGFCRIGYTQSCFLFICQDGPEIETDYVPATNSAFLLQANARCANKKEYNLWSQAP